MNIPVEISARHVHLCEADFAALFGQDASLTVRKALSQPGEYLSGERVDIVGPKRTLANVAILGPLRKATQAELSLTDLRGIGVEAPIKESGDLAGSAELTLAGPKGQITLPQGLIAAKRHIHMTPEQAKDANVTHSQTVQVKITGERALLFGEVVVRVSPAYVLAMHVDTDEGNAAGVSAAECYGEIVG